MRQTLRPPASILTIRVQAGFTAIEMIMTIGFMSMAAGFAVPMVREYQKYTDIETASQHIVQAIRTASLLSQSGKYDSAWGVYLPDGVLFAGDSYALRNDDHDTVFSLPQNIGIHGPTELTFARITGLPDGAADFCIESVTSNAHRTLSMDQYGLVTTEGISDGSCPVVGTTTVLASNITMPSSSSATSSSVAASSSVSSVAGSSSSDSASSSDTSSSDSSDSSASETSSSDFSDSSSSDTSSSDSSDSSFSESSGSTSSQESSSASSQSSSAATTPPPDEEADEVTIPCYIRFALDADTGTITTIGTNDVTVKVLAAEGTYGPAGPAIRVHGSVSTDDGVTWSHLGNGQVLAGGEELQLENVMQGTPLTLNIQGRYSWLFNKTVRSDDRSGRIIALRNGDSLPPYAAFRNREKLPPALRSLIDEAGRIVIGEKSVLLLTELDVLDRSLSDFRDAVVLITLEEKAGTCTVDTNPTVSISLSRLENMGTGDATRTIVVGPDQLPFAEDQAIPLIDDNGRMIVDGSLRYDVPGLALERGDGWLRILSYGMHEDSSGKEIIDAVIRMNHATIVDIQNDTGADASEYPTDGQSDDTSSGDEFVPAADNKSVLFKTRVIADNDGIYIRWLPDAIAAVTDLTHGAAPDDSDTIDPCAVPFTVDASGMLTLGGVANITVRILGVDAVVGGEGSPRLLVRGRLSTDGGANFDALWENRVLTGNETAQFPQLPSGSVIAPGFTGRYSWTVNRSVTAGTAGDAIRVAKSGEAVEELRIAMMRGTLNASLRGLVDHDGVLRLGPRDVAYLIDMGETLPRSYQDIVMILTVEKTSNDNACLDDTSSGSSSSGSSSSAPSAPPVIIADTDGDGVRDDLDLCPGTVLPEPTPSRSLLVNRFALTAAAGDSAPFSFRKGPSETVSDYSIADTRGCSCTQILDAIASPSATGLSAEPVIYRQLKNLFPFYVETSRKFGCTQAILRIVAGH